MKPEPISQSLADCCTPKQNDSVTSTAPKINLILHCVGVRVWRACTSVSVSLCDSAVFPPAYLNHPFDFG